MTTSSKIPTEFSTAIWEWLLSFLRRIFGRPLNDDSFRSGLLEEAVQQIAEALDLEKRDVRTAFQECRNRQVNELAQRLRLRVDCSLKKTSASKVSVTLTISLLKEGKHVQIRMDRDASWDELPRDVRAVFIRNNLTEAHYVLCEQPQVAVKKQ